MTNETENTGVNPEDFGITSVAGVFHAKAQTEQEDKKFYHENIERYFNYCSTVSDLLFGAGRKEEVGPLLRQVDAAKRLFADPEDLRYYRLHPDEMIGDLLMIFITSMDMKVLGATEYMKNYFVSLGIDAFKNIAVEKTEYPDYKPLRELFTQRQLKDIKANEDLNYQNGLTALIQYLLSKDISEIFQSIVSGLMVSVVPQKMIKVDLLFLRSGINLALRERAK